MKRKFHTLQHQLNLELIHFLLPAHRSQTSSGWFKNANHITQIHFPKLHVDHLKHLTTFGNGLSHIHIRIGEWLYTSTRNNKLDRTRETEKKKTTRAAKAHENQLWIMEKQRQTRSSSPEMVGRSPGLARDRKHLHLDPPWSQTSRRLKIVMQQRQVCWRRCRCRADVSFKIQRFSFSFEDFYEKKSQSHLKFIHRWRRPTFQ